VFKAAPEKKQPLSVPASPIETGFGRIMDVSAKLRTTIHFKKIVDSLSALPVLSPRDSVILNGALDSLKQLNP